MVRPAVNERRSSAIALHPFNNFRKIVSFDDKDKFLDYLDPPPVTTSRFHAANMACI